MTKPYGRCRCGSREGQVVLEEEGRRAPGPAGPTYQFGQCSKGYPTSPSSMTTAPDSALPSSPQGCHSPPAFGLSQKEDPPPSRRGDHQDYKDVQTSGYAPKRPVNPQSQAVSSTMAKRRAGPQGPSSDERVNGKGCIGTKKQNEVLLHATVWMNPGAMLSAISQRHKRPHTT